MQAIFNGSKSQPFNADFVAGLIKTQLTQGVAVLKNQDPAQSKRFFLQHVALETFYYLGKGADLSLLIPFIIIDDYHVEISVCGAVGRIDSPASRELLMKFIEGKGARFAKVMCVWALKRQNAREMIRRLEAYVESGTDQETGFGGNIMDPRVGTYFPTSVKDSIKQLLNEWTRPLNNKSITRGRSGKH